jgi:hypothetical protein
MTPSDLDTFADTWLVNNEALTSGGVRREAVVRLVRAVAAAVKREDARKFRSAIRGASESMDEGELYEVCDSMRDEAAALAPSQEPKP